MASDAAAKAAVARNDKGRSIRYRRQEKRPMRSLSFARAMEK
jgi:hypothetical protein